MAVMFSWKAAGSSSILKERHFNRGAQDFSKFIPTRPPFFGIGVRFSCT
jgi:hypothetical protein